MNRYERVIEIVDNSVGGANARVNAPHRDFWRNKTRDEFVADKVFGVKLIEPGDPTKSGLIDALRGRGRFGGQPYRRMPPEDAQQPYPRFVTEEEIQFIEDWIADGCPVDELPDDSATPPSAVTTRSSTTTARTVTQQFSRYEYKIHPGIGIARIGTSRRQGEDDGWFVGPEVPDENWTPPNGVYRDCDGAIRRQGCRFRVYEYAYIGADDREPHQVREITDDDAEIKWHVHVVNRKSFLQDPTTRDREDIPNDPGEKTIQGCDQSTEIGGAIFGQGVSLGTLKTDPKGRLIVLGGYGENGSNGSSRGLGLYWPGWFDDVSDGPVRASIRLRHTGENPAVESAWVINALPSFAAPVINIVTMYDLALDVAVHEPRLAFKPPGEVSLHERHLSRTSPRCNAAVGQFVCPRRPRLRQTW